MNKFNEEDDEEEECFKDSFERLVSSSNTSCSSSNSNSEHENDEDPNPNYDPLPKFPNSGTLNYDVWTTTPSSVMERRRILLQRLGLTGDKSRVHHRPSLSLSSHQLNLLCETTSYSSTSCDNSKNNNISGDSDADSDGKVSGIIRSKSDNFLTVGRVINVNNDDPRVVERNCRIEGSGNGEKSPVSCSLSPNKPPKGKIQENITSNGSFSSLLRDLGSGFDTISECNVVDDVNRVCVIKNPDNGKEFVVNEVRKDGMWEKIKEVGTGRQLTMEEFSSEICVGTSPIVQELMRRQNVEDNNNGDCLDSKADGSGSKLKKKRSWLRSIKDSITRGQKEKLSSDERDISMSFDKGGGRRSSSATDDSQEVLIGPERIRARQYGKPVKELSVLYKCQEMQAHNGSIWMIKFSLDGKYLASAGEDCLIRVWQVEELEKRGDFLPDKSEDQSCCHLLVANGSPETFSVSPNVDGTKRRGRSRSSISRKSMSFEQILLPERVFTLLDKPLCSLHGHLDDVLDLSWSRSRKLLSSSMDKTVRLWDLSTKSCLKIFSHNDYVTCIQFNPVDDRYFISGSLDAKVRIWSIPDRKVLDWNDLNEMVTAACYTPDGQGALVGTYKGSCRLYNTSDNKLQQKCRIDLQNKKKKPHQKKVTGFQFSPGSKSEVLITSADSRIRVIDDIDLVHKFKGFVNTNSQISASLTCDGKYVISASEDSHVYVWRHENESEPNRNKSITTTHSYELFHCEDVSVAIPWPGISTANHTTAPVEEQNGVENSPSANGRVNSPLNGTMSNGSADFSNGFCHNSSAWGMVIVTAGLKGKIKIFQNFGLPVRI